VNIINYNEIKFTSKEIKKAISENCLESRKECLPAGKGRAIETF
jgi:hypothetical protein